MTGQIYWPYTIRDPSNPAYDLMNLRSIEDWTSCTRNSGKFPNVVDVSDFGGTAREISGTRRPK